MATYGQTIRKIRKKHKLNQEDFAEMLGTYSRKIYLVEHDKEFLSESQHLIIMTYLGEQIIYDEN